MRVLRITEVKDVAGSGDVDIQYEIQVEDFNAEKKKLCVLMQFRGKQEDIIQAMREVFVM